MTRGESAFTVTTTDDVTIHGERLGPPSRLAFVIGHGFCGSRRNVDPLARKLAERGTVYALDFRGHGASEGLTTLGNLEALDLRAVIGLARRECGPTASIVTIGCSMGGIAVLREAASATEADAVVSISAPAEWMGQQLRARLLGRLVTSSLGRALARRYLSTRVEPVWASPPPPVDLVRTIAIPMVFIHGDDDRFVDSRQAKVLSRAAENRARLRVLANYGHAEAGFDERVVAVIDQEIEALGLIADVV